MTRERITRAVVALSAAAILSCTRPAPERQSMEINQNCIVYSPFDELSRILAGEQDYVSWNSLPGTDDAELTANTLKLNQIRFKSLAQILSAQHLPKEQLSLRLAIEYRYTADLEAYLALREIRGKDKPTKYIEELWQLADCHVIKSRSLVYAAAQSS